MAHGHSVYNTDERFSIDIVTRVITQQSGKSKLMQYDHNSERYEFEMDRYIDGHDMSLCNDVRVNYLNISSSRDGQTNGPYVVKDMQVSPDDENKIVFSWLISRNSTKYAGTLNFNISFRCLTGAIVDYAWYTDIFKGISVSTGIENNGNEYVEEYIDILEQWKQDVLANLDIGGGTVTSVNGIEPDESGNVVIEFPENPIKKIDSFDENALVNFRDLESGTYVLNGYFKPHAGSDATMYFSSNIAVQIMRGSAESHIQVCYPYRNCIQWLKTTDTEYEQYNTYLNDLATKTYVEELIGGSLAYSAREQVTHESATIGIYSLGYATLPYEFFPGNGEEYAINWDSTDYTATAAITTVDEEEVMVVGNTSFFGGSTNTEIPFGIISRSGRALVYSSESGEHTISITGYEQIPHKIPSEYVDYNPVVGVIDSSYYNYRYLNPAKGASITEVRKAAVEGNRDIIIRLDLDNWQGTLRYMGLTNVSTDGTNYVSALLFNTIKANNVSINDSNDAIDGTMQLEYWYALLEPTEGPPADAFVNLQFAEINLAPGTAKGGYYMRVNENGFWEVAEGLTETRVNELIDAKIAAIPAAEEASF